MRRLASALSLLFLLTVSIFSSQAQESEVANLRVAHFAPDAPAVDIYVDGEVAAEALTYPAVTAFLELAPDTYEVVVVPAGDDLDAAVIDPMTFDLSADAYTTIAAVGTIEDETLTLRPFTEEVGEPDPQRARATFFHAVAAGPAINIYGSDILLVDTLRFPTDSVDGAFSRQLPAGRYDFEVTPAGNSSTLLLGSDSDFRIEAGEQYLIAALGTERDIAGFFIANLAGETLANPVPDESDTAEATAEATTTEIEVTAEAVADGTAYVRAAHFSPDAPSVDIYVDGDVAVEGATYPTATGFLELAPGSHEIAVVPTGESLDDAVLGPTTFIFDADTYTTLVAVGSLNADTLTLTTFIEDAGDISEPQRARTTFFHAVADGPNVDVYSDLLLVENLRFPSAISDGAFTRLLPTGRYEFELTVSDSQRILATLDEQIRLQEGTQYLIAAVGTSENVDGFYIVDFEGNVVANPLAETADSE